jgi:hypothetical protein
MPAVPEGPDRLRLHQTVSVTPDRHPEARRTHRTGPEPLANDEVAGRRFVEGGGQIDRRRLCSPAYLRKSTWRDGVKDGPQAVPKGPSEARPLTPAHQVLHPFDTGSGQAPPPIGPILGLHFGLQRVITQRDQAILDGSNTRSDLPVYDNVRC